ncbi:DoxX family protein [Patescibacteria group bacterium]|nr:DoxX family protein [Patescibacteria group bacterium]
MMKLLYMKCSEKWADFAPLVLRLALGAVFFLHGYDKVFVKGIPAITGFMASLSLPAPELMAYILSYGELIGGALIILGALTYWATLFGIVVAVVAWVTVHLPNGFFVGDGGYEFIMLILAASVSLMISGAGKYSVDGMMTKKM